MKLSEVELFSTVSTYLVFNKQKHSWLISTNMQGSVEDTVTRC